MPVTIKGLPREELWLPGNPSCPGCPASLGLRLMTKALGKKIIVVIPACCSTIIQGPFPKTSANFPLLNIAFECTAATAAGVAAALEIKGKTDITVVGWAGDGGTVDIGIQAISGAAERGEQMIFVCVDNEGYMNTGMQRSGTTPYGSWTSTTPVGPVLRGKTRDSKYLPLLMVIHNCEYVATASMAFMEDYHQKLDKAIEAAKRGMAYIHVFSPCPTGWRFLPENMIEISRKAVETNMFPLWEFDYQTGELRFNYPVDNPLPLEEYLSLVGKFRHLSKEQIEHLKETSRKRIEILKGMSTIKRAGEKDLVA